MRYNDVKELHGDLTYMRNNPYDEAFFREVLRKFNNSSMEMKKALKETLYDRLFETHPQLVLKAMSKDNPDKIVVCRTSDDPFFEV